jgi:hypothetical protein
MYIHVRKCKIDKIKEREKNKERKWPRLSSPSTGKKKKNHLLLLANGARAI